MSQKSITTTTSFIVSSDESLNKPLPSSSSLCSSASSSSQSTYTSNNTNSNINMTTSDSIRINPCLGYKFNADSNSAMSQLGPNSKQNPRLHSQHTLTSMCVPPPPPPTCPTESFYGCLNNNANNNDNINNSSHQQVSIHLRGPSNIFTSGAYSHAGGGVSLSNQNNLPTLGHEPAVINQSATNQRNSMNNSHNTETPITDALMPINVKSMLLHGISGDEVLKNWLSSIKCEDYLKNFVDNGYDLNIITRMTPQDLTAIGCKTPTLRKKLLLEIKRLNIDDDIPNVKPSSLEEWLRLLRLSQYYNQLCNEGYDTVDKVCRLTWEDLEEIGITTLGHQKRLLMGIEKLQKSAQRLEEQQTDNTIYDVHPNHRMSLNGSTVKDSRFGTISRVRSGFFQTRSSANLDRRGMPVATVMPALKHVNSSVTNNSNPETGFVKDSGAINERICDSSSIYSSREQVVKMSDLTTTLKRTNPPLPPVRIDSLKRLQPNDCQSIYGNSFSVISTNGNSGNAPVSSIYGTATSFLRTPKLGTLTATTNKMLTAGGHIQTVVSNNKEQQIKPIREAPLPPISGVQSSLAIPEKIVEEGVGEAFTSTDRNSITTSICDTNSLIGHQLASADEFPPPPPCQ